MNESAVRIDKEQLKAKLLAAVQVPVKVASSSQSKVRNLMILGALSALWLAYALHSSLNLSLWASASVAIILLLPCLVLGKVFLTIGEVRELPERINVFFQTVQSQALEVKSEIVTALDSRDSKAGQGGIAGLLSQGKRLRAVVSLAMDVEGLSSAIGGAVIMANPLFMILLGASSIVIMLLALIAFVSIFFLL